MKKNIFAMRVLDRANGRRNVAMEVAAVLVTANQSIKEDAMFVTAKVIILLVPILGRMSKQSKVDVI